MTSWSRSLQTGSDAGEHHVEDGDVSRVEKAHVKGSVISSAKFSPIVQRVVPGTYDGDVPLITIVNMKQNQQVDDQWRNQQGKQIVQRTGREHEIERGGKATTVKKQTKGESAGFAAQFAA